MQPLKLAGLTYIDWAVSPKPAKNKEKKSCSQERGMREQTHHVWSVTCRKVLEGVGLNFAMLDMRKKESSSYTGNWESKRIDILSWRINDWLGNTQGPAKGHDMEEVHTVGIVDWWQGRMRSHIQERICLRNLRTIESQAFNALIRTELGLIHQYISTMMASNETTALVENDRSRMH